MTSVSTQPQACTTTMDSVLDYSFTGSHFFASYYECNFERLDDLEQLRLAMYEAAAASGATVLKHSEHQFTPQGITMVLLLSESHASIHTYPETGACFVDLFTCGNNCCAEKFDKVLREYLQPKRIKSSLVKRD